MLENELVRLLGRAEVLVADVHDLMERGRPVLALQALRRAQERLDEAEALVEAAARGDAMVRWKGGV